MATPNMLNIFGDNKGKMTLKIIHGSWYMTVIEGSEAYYPTTALAAYDMARGRG